MLRLLIVLPAIAALASLAAAKEPPVPPGLSPVGGVAVALLGPGVDYRRAEPVSYTHLRAHETYLLI